MIDSRALRLIERYRGMLGLLIYYRLPSNEMTALVPGTFFFFFLFPPRRFRVNHWHPRSRVTLVFFFPVKRNRFLGSGGASTSIQKCWIWEGSEGPMTCHFLKSLGQDSVCDINQDLKASSRTRPSGSEKQPIQRMSFGGVCFCKRSGQSVSAFHKSEAGPADFSCPSFNFQSHSIYFI